MTERNARRLDKLNAGIAMAIVIVGCLSVLAAPLYLLGCQHTPPTLSPAGATAFQNHQVQKALDTIRDIAVDANATTPPVLSTATTRKVVTWHSSAITVVHARNAGWVAVVSTGLDELLKDVPAAERQTLAPYITLAKTLLVEAAKS